MGCFEWNGNNKIDFESIEKKLGFEIHKDLKEFYIKNTVTDHIFEIDKSNIYCMFNGVNWFEESDYIHVVFAQIDQDFEKDIIFNFDQEAIYGSDEDNEDIRYSLGYLEDFRGRMGLYFNNKTGAVEFCDYEYGADSWSECPRAIISDSIKEFVQLLN